MKIYIILMSLTAIIGYNWHIYNELENMLRALATMFIPNIVITAVIIMKLDQREKRTC